MSASLPHTAAGSPARPRPAPPTSTCWTLTLSGRRLSPSSPRSNRLYLSIVCSTLRAWRRCRSFSSAVTGASCTPVQGQALKRCCVIASADRAFRHAALRVCTCHAGSLVMPVTAALHFAQGPAPPSDCGHDSADVCSSAGVGSDSKQQVGGISSAADGQAAAAAAFGSPAFPSVGSQDMQLLLQDGLDAAAEAYSIGSPASSKGQSNAHSGGADGSAAPTSNLGSPTSSEAQASACNVTSRGNADGNTRSQRSITFGRGSSGVGKAEAPLHSSSPSLSRSQSTSCDNDLQSSLNAAAWRITGNPQDRASAAADAAATSSPGSEACSDSSGGVPDRDSFVAELPHGAAAAARKSDPDGCHKKTMHPAGLRSCTAGEVTPSEAEAEEGALSGAPCGAVQPSFTTNGSNAALADCDPATAVVAASSSEKSTGKKPADQSETVGRGTVISEAADDCSSDGSAGAASEAPASAVSAAGSPVSLDDPASQPSNAAGNGVPPKISVAEIGGSIRKAGSDSHLPSPGLSTAAVTTPTRCSCPSSQLLRDCSVLCALASRSACRSPKALPADMLSGMPRSGWHAERGVPWKQQPLCLLWRRDAGAGCSPSVVIRLSMARAQAGRGAHGSDGEGAVPAWC